MSPITTHVLDTALGRPAEGIAVTLERQDAGGGWTEVAQGVTNADGRIADLMEPGTLEAAIYRITFNTGPYLAERAQGGFYPSVPVVFQIDSPDEHYHVPLLLNPYGYSTYRGS
jgi:5-hydroxyisourate hydrolase